MPDVRVNARIVPSLGFHLLAVVIAGYTGIALDLANALVPALADHQLPTEFPYAAAKALGLLLIPRFSKALPD